MSATAVAIINTSNSPLLLRTIWDNMDKEQAIKLTYLMHASLDIVDEKIEQQTSRDNFLGVLHQCEKYKIYGLMSATKVKVLLVIGQPATVGGALRENDIRQLLKNIHKAFIDSAAMNPFYQPNQPVKSKRLDSHIDNMFLTHGYIAPSASTLASAGAPPTSPGIPMSPADNTLPSPPTLEANIPVQYSHDTQVPVTE